MSDLTITVSHDDADALSDILNYALSTETSDDNQSMLAAMLRQINEHRKAVKAEAVRKLVLGRTNYSMGKDLGLEIVALIENF
jgi:hypothetical protein